MPPPRTLAHQFAHRLAESFLLAPGKRLFQANQQNYNLPLSKLGKLQAGGYAILRDYADGLFPPTFDDQARAYQAEISFYDAMAGASKQANLDAHRRKPFWGTEAWSQYSRKFGRLLQSLQSLGLAPGSRLLELGCGCGWMAEFLALSGYHVLGTTIMPDDVALGQERARALQARHLTESLEFLVSPMESVHTAVSNRTPFDAVIVFEALHHAFDWRQSISSAARCLKPAGWLLLANEPNTLHTFISYRIAKLSNTHEIGMSRKELTSHLSSCGLAEIRILAPRWDNRMSEHWIAARSPTTQRT
ncbi:MAG: class I SAM-dependent methyltransferase [Verrucomicrobia bacterium]|nr:class I SAM-dependent methyltransferase [Verrucomicrobiota bacterium]